MTIFTININNEMVEAPRLMLEKEAQLEDWLSNSPWAIANEDLLIIGRQTRASIANNSRFPDLMALDHDGNLVVIELKKGRAPREVVAQLLEYAAWAYQLSDAEIAEISGKYLQVELGQRFIEYFEVDELPALGSTLRLFIAAEEIPESVSETCRFLRQNHGLDITCVSYRAYRDPSGNTLVDSSLIVGGESINSKSVGHQLNRAAMSTSQFNWNGATPVKEIIWQAVQALTKNDAGVEFSPKDVIAQILTSYPTVNKNTIRCQIASDCVNHPSRHHWPGGIDRYWQVSKGRYRLLRHSDVQKP